MEDIILSTIWWVLFYWICPWKCMTKRSDIKRFMLSFMWSFCKRPFPSFLCLCICGLLSVYCADVTTKKKKENFLQSEESNSLTLQIAANVKQGSHTGPAAKVLSERAICTSEPCKSLLTSVSGLDLFVFLGRLIWLPSGPTKWSVTAYPDNLRQPVMKSARQALQMDLVS